MSCRGDGVPPSDELGGVKRDREGIGKRGWLVRPGVAIVVAAFLFLEVWAFKVEHRRERVIRERYEGFAKAPYSYNLPPCGTWLYVKDGGDYEFIASGAKRVPKNGAGKAGWYLIVDEPYRGVAGGGRSVYSYGEVRAEVERVLSSLPEEAAGGER